MPMAKLCALNYVFPALRCLFYLFLHADVIGFELYFAALRSLFNLFPRADVYWSCIRFPALFVYLFCFLMQLVTRISVSCMRCFVQV